MRTKLIIVDDHRMIRQCVRQLVEQCPELGVIEEAKDGREAVQLAAQHQPDVVLMDVTMPYLNGVEATRLIRERSPGTRVIALTTHGDRKMADRMVAAGARGFVSKTRAFEELAEAIRTVVDGKLYLGEQLEPLQSDPEEEARLATLTAREREVLQLFAEGFATKQIASQLHVSVKTIETFRSHLFEKLGVDNVALLTKYALRQRLTSL